MEGVDLSFESNFVTMKIKIFTRFTYIFTRTFSLMIHRILIQVQGSEGYQIFSIEI